MVVLFFFLAKMRGKKELHMLFHKKEITSYKLSKGS